MRVAGIVLAGLCIVGCHRAPAPEVETPALEAQGGEEQLDALIIDERPTMVATEFGECPFEIRDGLTADEVSRIQNILNGFVNLLLYFQILAVQIDHLDRLIH